MTKTGVGIAVGTALGFAVAFGTFGQMVIVALFALIGWGVAKVLAGEVDLERYSARRRSSR